MAAFKYTFKGQSYSLDLPLDSSLLNSYRQAPRKFSYTGQRPSDWQLQYYRMFVQHPGVQGTISDLARQLRAISPQDLDMVVGHAVAFVQTAIAYDHGRANSNMEDGLLYPLETLAAARGVCADKSLLLARLLLELGYGVALFSFPRANHMAVGLQVPAGMGEYGSAFAYVETTDAQPIGLIPDRMHGGVRLDGRPEINELGRGRAFEAIRELRTQFAADTREYGKDFVRLNPVQQQLKREMVAMEARMNALKPQLRGCSGTLAPDKYNACQKLISENNTLVAEYNALVARFNAANA